MGKLGGYVEYLEYLEFGEGLVLLSKSCTKDWNVDFTEASDGEVSVT